VKLRFKNVESYVVKSKFLYLFPKRRY